MRSHYDVENDIYVLKMSRSELFGLVGLCEQLNDVTYRLSRMLSKTFVTVDKDDFYADCVRISNCQDV